MKPTDDAEKDEYISFNIQEILLSPLKFIKHAWQGNATPWKVLILIFVLKAIASMIPEFYIFWLILSVLSLIALWRCASPERTSLYGIYRGLIFFTVVINIIKILAAFS